jgi:gliding motility-associated-like protein
MTRLNSGLLMVALLLGSHFGFAQRGLIIKKASASGRVVMDPNLDDYISEPTNSPPGFTTNGGYFIDEFEIPMFGIPSLYGDVPGDNIGKNCGITDLIPDSLGYTVYAIRDANDNLIFRFRLGDDNSSVEAYSILLDTDNKFGTEDPNYLPGNPGFEIDITLIKNSSNKGVYVYNVDGVDNCPSQLLFYSIDNNFQIAIADEESCDDPDFFYDFFVPFTAVASTYNGSNCVSCEDIDEDTGLRFAAVTNTSATCALGGNIADISGVDNGSEDYDGCDECAFIDIIDNQCPTPISDLELGGAGFEKEKVTKPSIDEPIRAGQEYVSGKTVESDIYVKMYIYSNQGTAEDPSWGNVPRESYEGYSTGKTWEFELNTPLQAYDSIVARTQLSATSVPCGSAGGNNTSSTSVTIVDPNESPVAIRQVLATPEDSPKSFTLTGSDPDNDPITFNIVINTLPLNGSISGSGINWTYTPAANYFGADSIYFRVSDGIYDSINTIKFIITPVNDSPIANDDSYTTNEDTQITGQNVGANDSDIDGPGATYSLVSNAVHGVLVLNTNGTFTYTPAANYFGTDQFSYSRCDGGSPDLCDQASVSITINSVNDFPDAVNDSFSTNEDTQLNGVSVATNDNTTDGPSAAYVIVNNVAHGSLLLNTDGSFTYMPAADYNGTDQFTYTLCDGAATPLCDQATVSITVNSINDAPDAVDDSFNVNEDASLTGVSVATNDNITDGPAANFTIATGVSHGVLNLNSNGSFTYTPSANFNGTDQFTYNLCDGAGTPVCDQATVTITINSVNDFPDALTDSFSTNEDTQLNGASVATNDNTTDGPSATYSVVDNVDHGSLSFNADGSFTYMPTADFNGTDQFTYSLCDGADTPLCDQATVSITVNSVNDSPDAVDDSFTINEDASLTESVATNDNTTDGPAATFTIDTGVSHGTLNLNSNGSFTYTPSANFNGSDQFTYNLCDEAGTPLCDQATVTITINSLNDAPVISGSASPVTYIMGGVTIDNSLQVTDADDTELVGGTVIISNNFVNGDNLVFINQNGIVGSYNSTTGELTLTGTATLADYSTAIASIVYENDASTSEATRRISFVLSDGDANSQPWNSFIDFPNNSGGPILNDDTFNANEDETTTICLDVTDPDGDLVFISGITSIGGNGSYVVGDGVCFDFTPDPEFSGTETAEVTLCDEAVPSLCITYPITITVDAVNDVPVANDDNDVNTFSTDEDVVLLGNVTGNDTDIDGPGAEYSLEVLPPNGSITFNSDGTFEYTPGANYNGTDQFTYSRCDTGSPEQCDQALVTITINAVNDSPVANDDSFSTGEDIALDATVADNDTDVDGPTAIYSVEDNVDDGTLTLNADGTFSYTPATDFSGTDQFTYKRCDGVTLSSCDQSVVTITVDAINDAPVANDDNDVNTFSTDEDIPLTGTVSGNDTDVDGPAEDYSLSAEPTNGSLIFNADGTFEYTPDVNYNGTDQFTYSRCDSGSPEQCDQALVTITIDAINDLPEASDDTFSTDEGTTLTSVTVAGNDVDVDGPTASYDVVNDVGHGSLTLNTDGTFEYIPDSDFTGTDQFTYERCDGVLPSSCAQAVATITVNAVNNSPVAADESYTIDEDTQLSGFNVGSNDDSTDGPTASYSVAVAPPNGTVSLSLNGSFTYTPNSNFNGSDQFTYSICDGATPNLCDQGVVSITINATNDAPTSSADSFSTNEDTDIIGANVGGNDVDVDGPSSIYTLDSDVSHGTLTLNPDGTFDYDPAANFSGSDHFDYILCDGASPSLCSSPVTVTIIVNAVNDAPVASDDSDVNTFSIDEDEVLAAGVAANDSDLDGPSALYSLTNTTTVSNGTLVFNSGGTFLYTPDTDFYGTEQFTYQRCDNGTPNLCDEALVTIIVNAVNDSPLASDDSFNTLEETPLTAENVAINDSDVDGPGAVYAIVDNASHGTLSFNVNGNFSYTPSVDFAGVDQFTYNRCDVATPSLCSQATVFINVTGINDGPIANDDSFETDEDKTLNNVSVASNDTKLDGPQDTFTVLTNVSHGQLTLNTDGSFQYKPDAEYKGNDSFTYNVCDGANPNLCDQATVTIKVNSVNDSPVAKGDSYSVDEDQELTGNVSDNDTDVDGPKKIYTVVTDVTHGTLTLNANGSFIYKPNPNFDGIDEFAYNLCDDGSPNECKKATVTITVNSVNDSPITVDDSFTTTEDTQLTGANVALNDDIADGPGATYTIVNGASHGELIFNANGTLLYNPAKDFNGMDQFTYRVCDGGNPSLCTEASATISVTAVNDAPQVIVNDNVITKLQLTIKEDTPIDFCFKALDVDGETVSLSDYEEETLGGALIRESSGSTNEYCFRYNPKSNYFGKTEWDLSICDASNLCIQLSVTIQVLSENDLPVAANQSVTIPEDTPATITLSATDVDGDNLKYSIANNVTHGTITINNNVVQYTPAENYFGPDSFTFRANDGKENSNDATVSINVTSVNDAPAAFNLSMNAVEDIPEQFCLQATDADGDNIALGQATNQSGGGDLVATSNGLCYTFTPEPNYNGYSIWGIQVCDAQNLCTTVEVKILVTPVNDTPAAQDDFVDTPVDSEIEIDVLSNDRSIESPYDEFYDIFLDRDSVDNIAITRIKTTGSIATIENNKIKFTPDLNYSEQQEIIWYWIKDSGGLVDSARVFIDVGPARFRIFEALSPNGDGKNDYWRINGIEQDPNNVVRIFDRFNNLVFETKSYNNETNNWQGQSNHGLARSQVPEGTYYYTINIDLIDDTQGERLFSGFVVLKRN